MSTWSLGTVGLIAIGASVAFTFAVAVAGPSVMEPVLPGPAGPPWSLGLHPSPYLAVSLTAAGLAAGLLGLVLVLRAVRRGWSVPARAVLMAGLLAAVALTLVPPFPGRRITSATPPTGGCSSPATIRTPRHRRAGRPG